MINFIFLVVNFLRVIYYFYFGILKGMIIFFYRIYVFRNFDILWYILDFNGGYFNYLDFLNGEEKWYVKKVKKKKFNFFFKLNIFMEIRKVIKVFCYKVKDK